MKGKRIFLTGASGFIGSHLAEWLVENGYDVMALKRRSTDLWRCEKFLDKITWISEESIESLVVPFRPDTIIHLGWTGITHQDREDWNIQFSNFEMLFNLLRVGKLASVRKFIGFGSQAEYGSLHGRLDESATPEPSNAYAVAKMAAQKAIQVFCDSNQIEWYWLRVYSVFGPKEDKKWFLPMIIDNLLKGDTCNLTKCEQQYDYLYVKDLSKMIQNVIDSNKDNSGIYNISSNTSKPLRSIVQEIQEIIGSQSTVNFGALPYRQNQTMHIEGNCNKYYKAFVHFNTQNVKSALVETIEYYKNA